MCCCLCVCVRYVFVCYIHGYGRVSTNCTSLQSGEGKTEKLSTLFTFIKYVIRKMGATSADLFVHLRRVIVGVSRLYLSFVRMLVFVLFTIIASLAAEESVLQD